MSFGPPKAMDRRQLEHVRHRMFETTCYLQRLVNHLAATKHDDRHTYYRRAKEALTAVRALETASTWARGDSSLVDNSFSEAEY